MFLQRGGVIFCEITGTRQYSLDLPQGGLELPCKLKFSAAAKEITKIRKLLTQVTPASPAELTSLEVKSACDSVSKPAMSATIPSATVMKDNMLVIPEPEGDTISDTEPATKKPRTADNSAETVWLKLGNILTWYDKEVISDNKELSDHHINYCQHLLSKQFPLIGGLVLTLLQNKPLKQKIVCGLQIIHRSERNHWIVASRIDSCHSPVKIYDSLYKSIHEGTITVVQNMFKKVGKFKIEIADMQEQEGSTDCGVFAIAVATSLLYGVSPSYNQDKMRDHLLCCLGSGSLSVFPSQ